MTERLCRGSRNRRDQRQPLLELVAATSALGGEENRRAKLLHHPAPGPLRVDVATRKMSSPLLLGHVRPRQGLGRDRRRRPRQERVRQELHRPSMFLALRESGR